MPFIALKPMIYGGRSLNAGDPIGDSCKPNLVKQKRAKWVDGAIIIKQEPVAIVAPAPVLVIESVVIKQAVKPVEQIDPIIERATPPRRMGRPKKAK